ncbi:MAG: ABC transporter substrate-binding protein [Pseudolabrys sp.]
MRLFKLFVSAAAVLWAATASAQQPLRVGFIPVMGAAQIFVADGEGWTKQAGPDVADRDIRVRSEHDSGPVIRHADVYVAGLAPILVARSKGIDVRVIAATVVEEMGFAAAPSLTPFLEGRKPAEAFKAFREKNGRPAKLATQPIGSGPNTALQHWLWEVAKADKARRRDRRDGH